MNGTIVALVAVQQDGLSSVYCHCPPKRNGSGIGRSCICSFISVTFTNKAWDEGDRIATRVFPYDPDCRPWCRIAKAAGAKGIIIAATKTRSSPLTIRNLQ